MRTYWNTNRGLRTLEKWEPNCWVQVTCPTQDDIDYLENTLHIPDYFLMDIADTDERARYEFDDGWILIILRIPYVKEVRSRTPYTTIPLGIILNKEVCITVCNFETNMMIDFVSYQQKRIGIHRLRRHGTPPVPFVCRVVPETAEANQPAHREWRNLRSL